MLLLINFGYTLSDFPKELQWRLTLFIMGQVTLLICLLGAAGAALPVELRRSAGEIGIIAAD